MAPGPLPAAPAPCNHRSGAWRPCVCLRMARGDSAGGGSGCLVGVAGPVPGRPVPPWRPCHPQLTGRGAPRCCRPTMARSQAPAAMWWAALLAAAMLVAVATASRPAREVAARSAWSLAVSVQHCAAGPCWQGVNTQQRAPELCLLTPSPPPLPNALPAARPAGAATAAWRRTCRARHAPGWHAPPPGR